MSEEDLVHKITTMLGGFDQAMGLRPLRASRDEVAAELRVADCHLQPYGLVHGGVYAGIVESLCSIGTAINTPEGKTVVGLENTTSFLRAVRSGTLRGVARPLSRGRRSQVWEAEIRDEQQRLVATGRVRALVLDAGSQLAGKNVAVESGG